MMDLPPPPTDMAPPPPAPVEKASISTNVVPPPPPANFVPPPPPVITNVTPSRGAGGLADQIGSGSASLKRAPEAGEKKPVEKRSALLSAIQHGTQLRKVDTEALAESKKKEATGGFNVAKILERKAAMDFSEGDDDSFGDDDWED